MFVFKDTKTKKWLNVFIKKEKENTTAYLSAMNDHLELKSLNLLEL